MRRDFGRHADRNAGSAVQQRKRQAGGQKSRFIEGAVVIGLKIDRAFGKLGEQQFGNWRQPRFGVAHRRSAVAVARPEIALAIDQRIAQGEGLRHAHHGVIGRGIAVWMVFADHVADDPR